MEQLPEVSPTVDPELGSLVREELLAHGVEVLTGVRVEELHQRAGAITIHGTPALELAADLVLVVVGVRAESELAAAAGAETGVKGAIRVNRRMETNLHDLFAAGDCVETYHRILREPTYLPLGTTAHKQGRMAGENAVGGGIVTAMVVWSQVGIVGYLIGPLLGGPAGETFGFGALGLVALGAAIPVVVGLPRR